MPQILKSKHQKLILQCYPPGRDIDKKPNSSELNYLLYYASTRRVKLEKVGSFLQKKTLSDLHHYSRYGNVQVSLLILENLISKCVDNLNVFANNIAVIFNHVLDSHDLILSQLVLKVFKVFIKHLDGNFFVGDREFLTNFVRCSQLLLNLGSGLKPGPEALQWQILSIKAAKYLSVIVGWDVSKSVTSDSDTKALVDRAITLVLAHLKSNFSSDALEQKAAILELRSHKRPTVYKSSSNGFLEAPLNTISTRRSSLANVTSNFETDNSTEDNINIETQWSAADFAEDAFHSLQAYFETGASGLSAAMLLVIGFILGRQDADIQSWSVYLFQIIGNWMPVQLRFMVVPVMMRRLLILGKVEEDGKSQPVAVSSENLDHQLLLTKIVSGLLSSKINMYGLSVLDILNLLLGLQTANVARQNAGQEKYAEVTSAYRLCIVSLLSHIYYHGQVYDIIRQVIQKIGEAQEVEKLALVEDLKLILESCFKRSNVEQDGIEVYGDNASTHKNQQELFRLVNQKAGVFVESWMHISLLHSDKQWVTLYFQVLIMLLAIDLDYSREDLVEYLETNELELLSGTHQETKKFDTEEPNYANLIYSASTNFIQDLLKTFDQVLDTVASTDGQLVNYLVIVNNFVLRLYGINFIHYGLEHVLKWQIQDDHTFNATLKDSFAYYLLSQYVSYLQTADTFHELTNQIHGKINSRVDDNIWNKLVPVKKQATNEASTELNFTKEKLLGYFEIVSYTNKWLVGPSSHVGSENGSSKANGHTTIHNLGFENSSILSTSKFVANLTHSNSVSLRNFSGLGPKSLNGSAIKVHDLKNMVSKLSLSAKDWENKTDKDASQASGDIIRLVQGLKFNDHEFNNGKLNMTEIAG